MTWFSRLLRRLKRPRRADPAAYAARLALSPPLCFEQLESRTLLNATASFGAGVVTITGGLTSNNLIDVALDVRSNQIVVLDGGRALGRFSNPTVTQLTINAGNANNVVRVANNVTQDTTITAGNGNNLIYAGGGVTTITAGNGNNTLIGGPQATALHSGSGNDRLYAREGNTIFDPGAGNNYLFNVKASDNVVATPGANNKILVNADPPCVPLTAAEVGQLLDRAAAATPSQDAIIAIVDRGGRLLGVRTEAGVTVGSIATPGLSAVQSFDFAIDGAIAEARTAAFFANDQAPLTSRTVQFISQSTITQREVNSSPDVAGGPTGAGSTLYGPGFVAPIGLGGHFPPNVAQTPPVDLFGIEHTNRDSSATGVTVNADGTTDPTGRFNTTNILVPPQAYGRITGTDPTALPRGVGTLPGGIPIFKNGCEVGGIGVFFPGKTGFASEENSSLSADFNPTKPDRTLEAEYIAFAAVGGIPGQAPIGTLGGVAPVTGIGLPSGRIDLVGITLDIFGAGGNCQGVDNVLAEGRALGPGSVDGANQPINPVATPNNVRAGLNVPEGFIVGPIAGSNAGLNLTVADINQIISQGIVQAALTRAAIRLPLGSRAKFVFAVSDLQGNVLAIFRQTDATTFSIDVAMAKARNVAYYANAGLLQAIDQTPGVPPGVAFTNRTFRFLAQPRFPDGIDGTPPGPFSILNDGGANPLNGLEVGPPLPATAFTSVYGHDSFFIGTNFRDPLNPANQDGIVFFPGSVPLYKVDPATGQKVLVGGLGVSGDGVDQDDVTTAAAARGFEAPPNLRADQFFFAGVRLPYQKFNRNPEG
jgi:uncharacterized protein GlcG (DUF336 family)